MRLSLVTAPAALALDWVSEVKGHLRLITEEERDRVEQVLIPAATSWAETATGRALITQTWKLLLDGFPSGLGGWLGGYVTTGAASAITLPKPPLQSVTTVKYVDESGVLQT